MEGPNLGGEPGEHVNRRVKTKRLLHHQLRVCEATLGDVLKRRRATAQRAKFLLDVRLHYRVNPRSSLRLRFVFARLMRDAQLRGVCMTLAPRSLYGSDIGGVPVHYVNVVLSIRFRHWW